MTEGTEAITTIHLMWIGLLALVVLVAIIAGVRLQRRRVQAEREVQAHAEEAGVVIAPPAQEGALLRDEMLATRLAASLPDEPIAAAVEPEGTPATIAADAAPTGAASPAEGSITQLKGLGPKVASRLAELGIDRVGQLATLDEAQAAALDAELGPFAGRLQRDRWVEQARLLAAGDRDGFERVFGRL